MLTAGAALAEIEARAAPRADAGQVDGIADLQPTRDGKMLAEAVAGLKDGKVLVASFYEDIGVFAPALALFTRRAG